MTHTTETITADQLVPGDIVTQLRRDDVPEHPRLSAGSVRIEAVRTYSSEPLYVSVRYQFGSRNCVARCWEDPYSCWHYGEAGGGTGRVLATQQLERYVR